MSMYKLKEYSSNYSETTEILWFYWKDGTANFFNAGISNSDYFNSFKYKNKLFENTKTDVANGILKNAIIAVSWKCLINFWRSLKMPLINCNVELKFKRTKYCVLFAAGNDDKNADLNNIMFTIKDTNLYVPL